MEKKFVIFTHEFLSPYLTSGKTKELMAVLQEIAVSGISGIFITDDIDFLMNNFPGTLFQFRDACILDCKICEEKNVISSKDIESCIKYREIKIGEGIVISNSTASLENFHGDNLKFIVVSDEHENDSMTGKSFTIANKLSSLPGMLAS